MNKLHFIENFGTGIPRTFEAYDKYNVKPNFNPSESFFSVTLPNVNYYEPIKVEEQKVETSINLSSSLTDLDLLILKTIKEHPGINGNQIFNILSKENKEISLDMVKNSLKRHLKEYCKFIGSNNSGGYHLKI